MEILQNGLTKELWEILNRRTKTRYVSKDCVGKILATLPYNPVHID